MAGSFLVLAQNLVKDAHCPSEQAVLIPVLNCSHYLSDEEASNETGEQENPVETQDLNFQTPCFLIDRRIQGML